MSNPPAKKGSSGQRFLIGCLCGLLTLLFIWLLSFIDRDIGDWPGPDLERIRATYVDAALQDRRDVLQVEKGQLTSQIDELKDVQEIQRRSMAESREAMNQMIEIHRLSLEKGVTPTESEQEALAQSQTLYLTKQQEFQQDNEQITQLNQRQRTVEEELRTVSAQLNQQEQPARQEYDRKWKRHRVMVASVKLLFIVPVLLLAAWLGIKYKRSPYVPIVYALLVAAFWRVGVVMHAYFPRDYFKYIAVAAGIGVVLAFIIFLIRMAVRPRPDVMLKQYREAYHHHRCPMCAYPILRGPLKYVVWSAKGPRGPLPAPQEGSDDTDKPYTCPACGARLYDTCPQCHAIRHCLLPYCESCGQEQSLLEPSSS